MSLEKKEEQHQELSPEQQAILEQLVRRDPDNQGVRETFSWDDGYQDVILGHLLADERLLARHHDTITPKQFLTETNKLIWRLVAEYYQQFKSKPSRDYLMVQLDERLKGTDDANKLRYKGQLVTLMTYHDGIDSFEAIDAQLRAFAEMMTFKVGVHKALERSKKPEDHKYIDVELKNILAERERIRTGLDDAEQWIDLVEFGERAEQQRPDWIVPGWLQEKRLHLFTGREKSGKSTILWNLVVQLMTGGAWFGHKITKQYPVVYLDYENGDDYAWDNLVINLVHAGTTPAQVRQFWKVPGPKDPNRPRKLPGALTAEWLSRNLPKASSQPGVCIVDAGRPAFAGSTDVPDWENKASEVERLLKPIADVTRTTGWGVVIVHHNNKGDVFSGSTAWRSVVDHAWSFRRPEDSDKGTLEVIGRVVGKRPDPLCIVKQDDQVVCDGSVPELAEAAKSKVQQERDDQLLVHIPMGDGGDGAYTTIKDVKVTLQGDPYWHDKTIRMSLDRLQMAGRVRHRKDDARNKPHRYWRDN